MSAPVQTSTLRDLLGDPDLADDLLDLARAGIEHRRAELGRELSADEFAVISWPEFGEPAELRVFQVDGGLAIRDTAGHDVAAFV